MTNHRMNALSRVIGGDHRRKALTAWNDLRRRMKSDIFRPSYHRKLKIITRAKRYLAYRNSKRVEFPNGWEYRF